MTPALTITRRRTAPQTKVVISKSREMPEPANAINSEPPLTMDVADVARELKVSEKSVLRMHANGKLPQPIIVSSRSLRWCRKTLVRWIISGAPPREEFEKLTHQ